MPQAFQTYGCKVGDFLCDVHVTEASASALRYSAGYFWETLSTHAHRAQHAPLTVFWIALNHVCQLVKWSDSSGYGICPGSHVSRRKGREWAGGWPVPSAKNMPQLGSGSLTVSHELCLYLLT